MPTTGDDCYFYYYSSCAKGAACPFRHCPEAIGNEIECQLWREGRCFRTVCIYRHMEIKKNRQQIACYWENQAMGCQRANCMFKHSKPRIINGMRLEPDIQPAVAGLPTAAPPVHAAGLNRDVKGQHTPSDSPIPSPAPKVQQVVINFDEESDADSIQGTPVKNQPARLQEVKVPDKPTFVSPKKETEQGEEEPSSEDLEFGVKSLEELRREKVRIAKKLLEEAENELRESGASVDTPPPAPRHSVIKSRMSPPKAAPTKKIRVSRSSPPVELPIKSLEEIRREQALATLNRGSRKRIADDVSDRSVKSEEPAKKVVIVKPSNEEDEEGGGELKIKSLEEIRREQALASMRKRIAEKELAKKQAESKSAPRRRSSTESIEDDVPAARTVTRRVVIASEDEPSKPKPAPKAPLSSRLGGRKITVQSQAKDHGIKSRLGFTGGIKRRLGLTTESLRKNRENEENEDSDRRRDSTSSRSSVSSSEIFSDDEIEEIEAIKKERRKEVRQVPTQRSEAAKKEPVITRKITIASTSSDTDQAESIKRTVSSDASAGVKKARRAAGVQLYKPPAWKQRTEKSDNMDSGDSTISSSRPVKGGRKAVEWGAKSYSEILREKKRLAKAATSTDALEEKPRSISPISFDDTAQRRKPRVISPVSFDKPRSLSPDPAEKRRRRRSVSPIKFSDKKRRRSVSPVKSSEKRSISPVTFDHSNTRSLPVSPARNREPIRKPAPRKGPKLVWSTRVQQPTKIERIPPSDDTVTLKPTRKLTLNTKKLNAEPKPSPIRPAFMRALPTEEETANGSSSEKSSAETVAESTKSDSPPQVEKLPTPKVKSPTVKTPTIKTPLPNKTPSTVKRRQSRTSSSSSKADKKPAANSNLDDLGQEMDLLDDDLIDLFTDDTDGEPVTSTATNDDELLAQMEEFLS